MEEKEKLEEKKRNVAITKFARSIKATGLKAKQNCRICYGRGYIGRDINTNLMKPCKCLRRGK